MVEPGSLPLYVAVSLALSIVPGPSVLYVVALSAILATSATAFAVVTWAGAAYLVILGVRTWLERDPEPLAA